jgi:hypothetical protein
MDKHVNYRKPFPAVSIVQKREEERKSKKELSVWGSQAQVTKQNANAL